MAKPSRSRTRSHKASPAKTREVTPEVRASADGIHARLVSPVAIATFVLLLISVVTTWPIWRDGHATYLDNPAHLAEVHSLAFDAQNGCGHPIWGQPA